MSDRMTVACWDPTQAHQALVHQVWPALKSALIAGRRMVLELKQEPRSQAQNRRYWGRGVLAQIAEQAVVGGRKFDADTWHEQFKRQFIGVIELPNGQVLGMSSTKLTKGEFCRFCDEVEAFATTELGVRFVDLEPHP